MTNEIGLASPLINDKAAPLLENAEENSIVFPRKTLSGILRYYLDEFAAPGQPQFRNKRTICGGDKRFYGVFAGAL
ncbi:unnamed protein product [Leptosia nina]|uniref:Uncharacterized protein n=1 Tax=Leptosia nina TaxID=320188 RepID=A0AAV1JW02_9NEOP